TARIQYLNGSTWTTFGPIITLTGGTGHVTWNPGTSEFTYRFIYGSTVSDTFTVGILAPTVTGVPDEAVIPPMTPAGATVTVDPAPTGGTARLQYLNGSTWTTFGPIITLTGGTGHVTWNPGTSEFTYRFIYGSTVSDTFTVGIESPTVTGTPDALTIPPMTPAGATVTVDPAPTGGTARLQYLNGSTWTTFGPVITLVDGTGHVTWNPGTSEFTYRFIYGSTVSDTFTVGILAPTVTGTPDAAEIPAMTPAGATVTVDPAPTTGTARIQYLNRGIWTTFGPVITLVNGTGHVIWNPGKSTFTYRFVYGSTVSETFVVTMIPTA
ncbi:MAG: hypothetical protein JW722_02995, partial [Demequinaceae bacterium]|nr:hypothetical protein [Demequinaceae bacterium]